MESVENKPQEQSNGVHATNASFFANRRAEDKKGHPIKVNDQVTFFVGRPKLSTLTKTGVIPAQVAAAAQNVMQKLANNSAASMTAKEMEDYQEYERLIVMASMRSPVVVEKDPVIENNEITIDMLSDEEVTLVTVYVQGGQQGLNTFRSQRARQIAGLNSETLQSEAE